MPLIRQLCKLGRKICRTCMSQRIRDWPRRRRMKRLISNLRGKKRCRHNRMVKIWSSKLKISIEPREVEMIWANKNKKWLQRIAKIIFHWVKMDKQIQEVDTTWNHQVEPHMNITYLIKEPVQQIQLQTQPKVILKLPTLN